MSNKVIKKRKGIIINKFESIDEIRNSPIKFANYYNKISSISDKLPYKFRQKIRYLRESFGLTREQLEEKSYISAQTIKQIETNENRGYSIETLLALCIGMELPPDFSFDLLRMAGFYIENIDSSKSCLYGFILRYMYNQGIETVNDFLIQNNELPLSGQNKKI